MAFLTVAAIASAVWLGVSLVTLLGDPLVVGGFGLAVYWFGDRSRRVGRLDPDRVAIAFATIVGALTTAITLKTVFAVGRLPGATTLPGLASMPESVVPIYTWIVDPGGYAFPSGHATAAMVGWVGLAWAFRGDRRERTLALGGVAVGAIAVSRVALGVHRPHEILAGLALGVAFLVITFGLLKRPSRAFALAGLLGTVGPIAVELTPQGLVVAGVALGTALGWKRTREHVDLAVAVPALATLLVAGVTFARSGVIETVVVLVGVGSGAAIVAGRNYFGKSERE
ncbi:MAG: phosphatase PAP2 family protein [Halorhabdus sp.]